MTGLAHEELRLLLYVTNSAGRERMLGLDQPSQPIREDMRIDLRRADIGVTEQKLQAAQVGPAGEQMRGEGVPEHVR